MSLNWNFEKYSYTHDHGLEVEASVMVWASSDGLERLLPGSRNLVLELIVEVMTDGGLRTRWVVKEHIQRTGLIHIERAMVAKQE